MVTQAYAKAKGLPATIKADYSSDPRLALAQELMKAGADTSPVASPLGGLARMLQAGIGGYQAGKVKDEYQERGDKYNSDLAAALQAGMGTPAQADLPGPTMDGTAGYDQAAQPGSLDAMVKILSGNPDTADIGAKLAMTQIAEQMKPKEPIKLGAGDILLDPKTNQPIFTAPPKEKDAPAGYAKNEDGTLAPIPGGPADPAVKTKPLPTSTAKDILANRQNLNKAQAALDLIEGKTVNMGGQEIKGNKEATGWKSYLPDALLQRTDGEGVSTRAAIADIGSMVIHDRSGAAVSASEFPRLRPFIPAATDDPQVAATKLKNFVATYKQIVDENESFFADSGYKVPESRSPEPPAAGGWSIEEVP